MGVSPAPSFGAVFVGRDVNGRALRVSSHADLGLVVLSIWQDDRCAATVRLAEEDIPAVVQALTATLLPAARPVRAVG